MVRPILHITLSTFLNVAPQEAVKRRIEACGADENTSLPRRRGKDDMALDASSDWPADRHCSVTAERGDIKANMVLLRLMRLSN